MWSNDTIYLQNFSQCPKGSSIAFLLLQSKTNSLTLYADHSLADFWVLEYCLYVNLIEIIHYTTTPSPLITLFPKHSEIPLFRWVSFSANIFPQQKRGRKLGNECYFNQCARLSLQRNIEYLFWRIAVFRHKSTMMLFTWVICN